MASPWQGLTTDGGSSILENTAMNSRHIVLRFAGEAGSGFISFEKAIRKNTVWQKEFRNEARSSCHSLAALLVVKYYLFLSQLPASVPCKESIVG
jgi:hypothetical protein